jgi:hypothetical protein
MRRLRLRRDREPDVTVCVPAFQAEGFIGEALSAITRQSHRRLRILVSLDASTDDTESVCREFERDPRLSLLVQPGRLGWVGNINFLLDRVETPFFVIHPHDDQLEETYVEALCEEAERFPEAVNVYCDVQTYGASDELRVVSGLEGPLVARTVELITAPIQGPPFRGLTRSWVLEHGLRMRDNPFAGFGAHELWVLRLLLAGPFRRVPRALYRRHSRKEPTAVTQGWKTREPPERLARWVEHSFACMEALAGAPVEADARARLLAAQLVRSMEMAPGARPGQGSEERRLRSRMTVLAALATRALDAGVVGADALARLRGDAALWEAVGRLDAG